MATSLGSGVGGGLVTKSCPTLMTPWTVACQASLSMGFSRQEYWSGLPFPSPNEVSRSHLFFFLYLSPSQQLIIMMALPILSEVDNLFKIFILYDACQDGIQ